MTGSLLRRLGIRVAEAEPAEAGFLDAVEERLRAMPTARAQLVAAFAGLLARVAYADEEISDEEGARIDDLVAAHSGLSGEESKAVTAIVRNRMVALRGAENHRLTRRFNEVADDEARRHLIDCLYAVATADDLVTHVEDREVRRIGDALLVPASEVLAIRSRYREKLEELQALRRLRQRP